MDISNLIESFADFAKQKNIDRPTMIRILEDAVSYTHLTLPTNREV